MEKAKIGAILKKRIAEKGYTQEEFAEIAGIGFSSLKKYISGATSYTVELLEIFSEKLECSYDYLLGKSFSPIRENQDISNELRLSDEAIKHIRNHAKDYDTNFTRKKYIVTLSTLIETDGLINTISEYFLFCKQYQIMLDKGINVLEQIIMSDPKLTECYDASDFGMSSGGHLYPDILAKIVEAKYGLPKEYLDEVKNIILNFDAEEIAKVFYGK
jgi:transcriptional regulator with XRE-family HTH domain